MVDAVLQSRRSVRQFLPDDVDRQTIEDILAVATRVPSGTNTQPWRVYVRRGAPRAELSRRIRAVYDDPQQLAGHSDSYAYYPSQWRSPYLERRRKVGWDLYGLLGIAKGDKERMHEQHARNFDFFGAPVGLLFTIDRHLEIGSFLDYGMFLQAIMTAARARGLDTCPQAAFIRFHKLIGDFVGASDDERVVCGMALGYADPDAVVNTLVTEREPPEKFASFIGF
jgi:nitroreductase